MKKRLTIDSIIEAEKLLQGRIRKTPLEYSKPLSDLLKVPVYLKLECLQKTGSFKLRGAYYRLFCLSEEERKQGVVTCSAGNHGKAVAYVAKELGIKAVIYVPRDVDQAKYQGMLEYGAEVVRSPFQGYDDTEEMARQASREANQTFISPFDDFEAMAGNGGTLAKEVVEEFPEARSFILPVGGGGLAAGFSFYIKEMGRDSQIIGCQHQDSPGLKLSLERGYAVTKLPEIETVAGGIEGGLGANCFEYLKGRIDQVALVSESEIISAFRWMLKHHQYLIEPSSAVTLAACLSGKIGPLNSSTIIIISGRNVSYSTIQILL